MRKLPNQSQLSRQSFLCRLSMNDPPNALVRIWGSRPPKRVLRSNLIKRPVRKSSAALRGIHARRVPIANQLVFVSHQSFQPHWAARMQFTGAYPNFCAEPVAVAISKPGRRVQVNTGGVHPRKEPLPRSLLFSDD